VNVTIGVCKVDALWRDARLVVEVDGGDGHATRAQMQRGTWCCGRRGSRCAVTAGARWSWTG
jgi:very-short-patch-repair endonuclease